jgi:Spy/CpxP family protein refolding chaperone
MRRSLILTLTAVLILGLTALAFAQRAKKPKAEAPKAKAELKLSDEQKEKMQAIRRQAAKEQIRLSADRKLAHLELQELLEAETPNQAAIDRQVQRLAELNAQMTKSKLQSRIAAGSVLTKEQKAGMRKMMANRMKMRMHQRMKVLRMHRAPGGRGPAMMFRGKGRPMGMESEMPGEAPAPEAVEMGLEMEGMEGFEPFAFFETDDMEPFEWELEEMAPMPDFPPPPADDEGWQ